MVTRTSYHSANGIKQYGLHGDAYKLPQCQWDSNTAVQATPYEPPQVTSTCSLSSLFLFFPLRFPTLTLSPARQAQTSTPSLIPDTPFQNIGRIACTPHPPKRRTATAQNMQQQRRYVLGGWGMSCNVYVRRQTKRERNKH